MQSAPIAGRLGRHWWPNYCLLVRAAIMENQPVPGWQKGDRRPRKHTYTTLALIKRQASKNPAKKAAYFKNSGQELVVILASPGPFYGT